VSVVCPVYDEEDGIEEFHDRCTQAMRAVYPPVAFELVYVDDGSTDRSLAILRKLAERDGHCRVLGLSRNFGHQIAITSGIDAATGDAVVVLDADLQDPPEVISDMVARWREGYKVVYGVRTRRDGESRFKLVTAKWFYRLLDRLSDTPLGGTGGLPSCSGMVLSSSEEARQSRTTRRGGPRLVVRFADLLADYFKCTHTQPWMPQWMCGRWNVTCRIPATNWWNVNCTNCDVKPVVKMATRQFVNVAAPVMMNCFAPGEVKDVWAQLSPPRTSGTATSAPTTPCVRSRKLPRLTHCTKCPVLVVPAPVEWPQ
jgi:hypothetical protein